MKLVVFSDAHGNKQAVERVINYNSDADYLISLGDSELPLSYLQSKNIVMIKGNYPFDAGFKYEIKMNFHNKKVYLTHGHKYGVHKENKKLIQYGLNKGFDLIMFGHTHIVFQEEIEGMLVLNPGSCSRPRNTFPPTYLIVFINENEITYTFQDAYTNASIEF